MTMEKCLECWYGVCRGSAVFGQSGKGKEKRKGGERVMNTFCDALQQNREQVAQAYFEM